jgi:glycosyltransferase involved in cell wall biosynthesis
MQSYVSLIQGRLCLAVLQRSWFNAIIAVKIPCCVESCLREIMMIPLGCLSVRMFMSFLMLSWPISSGHVPRSLLTLVRVGFLDLFGLLLKSLEVTIVVLSRLAYRKGIDLLVATAPRICAAFPNVRFVVGALLYTLLVRYEYFSQGVMGQSSSICYKCEKTIFSRIASSF